jgi:hypothetical protein
LFVISDFRVLFNDIGFSDSAKGVNCSHIPKVHFDRRLVDRPASIFMVTSSLMGLTLGKQNLHEHGGNFLVVWMVHHYYCRAAAISYAQASTAGWINIASTRV